MTERGRFILRLLTRRERQILPLVCAGFSNRKIAERLQVSCAQIIKNYLCCIFKKAGVESRHELVVFAWKHGIARCPCEARAKFLGDEPIAREAIAARSGG